MAQGLFTALQPYFKAFQVRVFECIGVLTDRIPFGLDIYVARHKLGELLKEILVAQQ